MFCAVVESEKGVTWPEASEAAVWKKRPREGKRGLLGVGGTSV